MFGRIIRNWLLMTMLAGALVGVAFTPGLLAQEQESGRKAVRKVTPVYPDLARRSNVTGVVKIEVTITAAGNVKGTKVVGGHPLLVAAALDALNKWKYEPGSGETTQTVIFNFDR